MTETRRPRRDSERTLLQIHLTREGEWRLTLLGVTLGRGEIETGDFYFCKPSGGWWTEKARFAYVPSYTRRRNGRQETVSDHDRYIGTQRGLAGTREIRKFFAIG